MGSIPEPNQKQSDESLILEPIAENIPKDLRTIPRWVCWRAEWIPEKHKHSKIPMDPMTGGPGSSTNPETWCTFEAAWHAYQRAPHRYAGIGIVLDGSDDLIGVDFDNVVNADGMIDAEILEWVERFDSYTEWSPSGRGLRIFVRGKLAKDGYKQGRYEIYRSKRFLTVTGRPLDSKWHSINENHPSAESFCKEKFDTSERSTRAPNYEPRGFPTWDALRHELGQRIMAHPTARKNSAGNFDCQGVCHDGKGATALFYDPADNAAYCNSGCSQETILRAFDLPEKPEWHERVLRTIQDEPKDRRGDTGTETDDEPSSDVLPDTEWLVSRTDEGNAQRFFKRWHSELRYCEIWQSWLYWDGRRWMRDYGSQAGERARITARDIGLEAALAANTELLKWAARSLDAGKIDAMLRLARKMPAFIVKPDELDRHPMLLNVHNGTIDLRTGKLHEHRREDYMTKVAPVDFDSEAKAPLFDQFLRDVFENDDLIADVQRLAGYSITGDVSGRIMPICWGSGRNGKNTFLEIITHILGDDYSTTIDPEILLTSRDRTPLHELAALDGIRFAVTDEVQEGRRLAESLVKRLTGSRSIHACRKYEHPYDFQVQFKIWMLTNHKPIVRDETHAMWDRLRLVPFERRFYMPDDEDLPEGALMADTKLPGKLLAESPGILNWLIAGCLRWQQDGLLMSEKVRTASREYRVESDSIGSFIEECCVRGEEYRVQSSQVVKAYNAWSGEDLSSKKFKPLLETRGFKFERNNRGIWVLGLALRAENSDNSDSEPVPF